MKSSLARWPMFLLACGTALSLGCHRQPPKPLDQFEQLCQDGLRKNPEDIKVELRTKDGKSVFHLYETIPIELAFSSSRYVTYSIELDETMNFAGQSDTFQVDHPESVFATVVGLRGVVCCGSWPQSLEPQPVVLKRDLTDFLRFEKPGQYRIFYTTRRVFHGPRSERAKDPYAPSKLLITSNSLTLTILPDDLEWDAKSLSDALRTLHDPDVLNEYKQKLDSIDHGSVLHSSLAFLYEVSQTRFAKAEKALNVLDTEPAIRERVSSMPKVSGMSTVWSVPVTGTTRPSLVYSVMQERAREPQFGVDFNFASCWATIAYRRDHPEAFRPTAAAGTSVSGSADGIAYWDAEKQIAAELQVVLPQKVGPARITTKTTLAYMKGTIARMEAKTPSQKSAERSIQ